MFNKIFFTFLVLSAVIFSATSKPIDDEEEATEIDHAGRVKRVTCDVLSANVNILGSGGQLNHSACALHCLYLRKRGGHCNSNAVCVCRK